VGSWVEEWVKYSKRGALTEEFAKFLTMASAYLFTSVTASPWKAWDT